jgi:hypothetical protein
MFELFSVLIQPSPNYFPFAFLILSLFFFIISFRRWETIFPIFFNILSIFFAYMMVFSASPLEQRYTINEANSTLVLLRNVTITSYSPQQGGIFIATFYVLFFFNLSLILYNFAFRYLLTKKKEE